MLLDEALDVFRELIEFVSGQCDALDLLALEGIDPFGNSTDGFDSKEAMLPDTTFHQLAVCGARKMVEKLFLRSTPASSR